MLKIDNLVKNRLGFLDNLDHEEYDNVARKINKKDNLGSASEFLQFLFKVSNIDFNPKYTRIYLTSHLIANFNDDLNIQKDSEIYKYSCYISRISRHNWSGFCKMFLSYINIFNDWKLEDKQRMLRVLAESYYNLDTTLKKIEPEEEENIVEFKAEIKKTILSILSRMMMIEPGWKEYLKNYNYVSDEELYNKMCKAMEKAYWDKLRDELKEEPVNVDILSKVLAEIREIIIDICPEGSHLISDIDEKFDIEFIMPQIQHNSYSGEQMYNLMLYLVGILRSLQAASDDNDTSEWWVSCCEKMNSESIIADWLPFFLQKIMHKYIKIRHITKLIRF